MSTTQTPYRGSCGPGPGTAFAAAGRTAAPAAHHVAEDVLENIRETAGTAKAVTATAAHAAVFESRVAETIVSGALLRILENLISFADFLELTLGFRVVRIAVGVIAHCLLAERGFQLLFVRTLADAQCLVEICLHHIPKR